MEGERSCWTNSRLWLSISNTLTIICFIALSGLLGEHLGLNYGLEICSEGLTKSVVAPSPQKPTQPKIEEPIAFASTVQIHRLPTNCFPIYYELYIHPELELASFSGNVSIVINITETTNTIVLHSNLHRIDDVYIRNTNDIPWLRSLLNNTQEEVAVPGILFNKYKFSYFENQSYEDAIFNVVDDLLYVQKNDESNFERNSLIELKINFVGSMDNRGTGFYKISYLNSENQLSHMAVTKFEPTYAREAFPCFDEPHLKAIFKIYLSLPVNSGYTALSNFLQQKREQIGNRYLISFRETTIPMSTYLVAFAVCKYKSGTTFIALNHLKGPVSIYYPHGKDFGHSKSALEQAVVSWRYLYNYTNVWFPVQKIDILSVPNYPSDGMESWGLIMCRDTTLFHDTKRYSAFHRQRMALLLAHEIAHFWFGNIVTMHWWNDLWLNEGIATFMSYKSLNNTNNEWKMMDQFTIEVLHKAFTADLMPTSHPVRNAVRTPVEILLHFDDITYSKAAAVLRMIENYVTPDVMQKGLSNYLNKYKYRTALTNDLIGMLCKEQPSMRDMFETFMKQKGVPMVNVKWNHRERGYDVYTITQDRFVMIEEDEDSGSLYGYKWTIPITYASKFNKKEVNNYVLSHHDLQGEIRIPINTFCVKFNVGQIGYYRVMYKNLHMWSNLIKCYHNFPSIDRGHLFEEMFAFAKAGQLNYLYPLNLTLHLHTETDYIPLAAAAAAIEDLLNLLGNSHLKNSFNEYLSKVINATYEELFWADKDNVDHLRRLSRAKITSIACMVGHEGCLNNIKEIFDDWIVDVSRIEQYSDLREYIYRYGMTNVNDSTWSVVFRRFESEQDLIEKGRLLMGLASVQSHSLLKRLVSYADLHVTEDFQLFFKILREVGKNPVGAPITWEYFRDQWLNIKKRFNLLDPFLDMNLLEIVNDLSIETNDHELKELYKKDGKKNTNKGLIDTTKLIEFKKNWKSNYKTVIEEWIKRITRDR